MLNGISGFRRHVDEVCALLGYYAASSGSPLRTFRYNVSVQEPFDPEFVILEDGTDTLFRNVGKGLPLYAA